MIKNIRKFAKGYYIPDPNSPNGFKFVEGSSNGYSYDNKTGVLYKNNNLVYGINGSYSKETSPQYKNASYIETPIEYTDRPVVSTVSPYQDIYTDMGSMFDRDIVEQQIIPRVSVTGLVSQRVPIKNIKTIPQVPRINIPIVQYTPTEKVSQNYLDSKVEVPSIQVDQEAPKIEVVPMAPSYPNVPIEEIPVYDPLDYEDLTFNYIPNVTVSANNEIASTPVDTGRNLSVSDNFDTLIRNYWRYGGQPIYNVGDIPLYQMLYDQKIINQQQYEFAKRTKRRPHAARYGVPNSLHKRAPMNLGNGVSALYAYDFSPRGVSFGQFLNSIYNNKELVNYLLTHNIGILEEFATDENLRGRAGGAALMRHTHATGPHTHWGPDGTARAMTIVRLKMAGYPVPDDIYRWALAKARPLKQYIR